METTVTSSTKTVVIGPLQPIVIIGERINPTGRKKTYKCHRRRKYEDSPGRGLKAGSAWRPYP